MDDVLREFLGEAGEHLDGAAGDLARLAGAAGEEARLGLFRRLHTLKGTAAFLPLPRLAALAHAAETGLERLDEGQPGRVRAIAAALDRMQGLLAEVARDGAEPEGSDADLVARLEAPGPIAEAEAGEAPAGAARAAEARETRTDPLLPAAPSHRASDRDGRIGEDRLDASPEPLARALARLPGLVRSLEAALAKPLDLVVEGEGVLVARGAAALVRDAVPHLVRNAADHGIEAAPSRLAAGKPARGRITVTAGQDGEATSVTVRDDGGGLDAEAIRRAARRDGRPPDGPAEVAHLVFAPGLSTAARVTPISGRGIGLSSVRALVEAAGGSVEIRSAPGRGTACTLRLPHARPAPAHDHPSSLA